MPNSRARIYPNTFLLQSINYPHMEPPEREMFRIWLKHHGQEFVGFQFDVRVGAGRPGLADSPDNMKRMWRELTKKRIDAIGFRGWETWLIEVKHTLNMMVIGQIDTYSALYMDEYFPSGPLVRCCVCQFIDQDVLPLAKQREIRIFPVQLIKGAGT